MDGVLTISEVWKSVAEIILDKEHKDRLRAAELWINHRHGKPKETKDLKVEGSMEAIRLIDDI